MASYIDPITGAVITTPNGAGNSSSSATGNTSSSNKGSSSSTSKDATSQTLTDSSTKVANQVFEYMEGSIEVLPNPDFRCRQVYGVEGVGYIFKGAYYFKKVRHSIGSTYKVDADVVRMEGISISSGTTVDRDRAPSGSSNPPQAPPAPPADSNPYIAVNRWARVTPAIGLNVRVNPGTNHSKVGALTCGTRIFCKGKKKGTDGAYWYDHDYKGAVRWSHGDYLRLE